MSKASPRSRLGALLEAYAADAQAPAKASERTRARILAAATEHFRRFGYRRASVDEIAKAAHVAKGSVYVHFANKADLLMHAVAAEKLALAHRFLPLFEEKVPPAERLKKALELALTALPQLPLVSSLLGGDRELFAMLEDLAPKMREQLEAQTIEGLSTLLSGIGHFDALSPAEREARCKTLYAVLVGLVSASATPRRFGLEAQALARTFAAIIVHGIGE